MVQWQAFCPRNGISTCFFDSIITVYGDFHRPLRVVSVDAWLMAPPVAGKEEKRQATAQAVSVEAEIRA